MQQRYCDPIAGRFLSVDPIVTDANTGKGFGLYTYVDNNPYAKIDPDGREPAECSDSCVKMRATTDAQSLGTSTTGASRSMFRAAAQEGRALAADFPSFSDTAKLFLPALMMPSMVWEGTMGTFDSLASFSERQASVGDGLSLAMAFFPVRGMPRLAAPLMHDHHLFPRQFKEFFSRRGIDINAHTVSLGEKSHLSGIHGAAWEICQEAGTWIGQHGFQIIQVPRLVISIGNSAP